MDYLSLRDNQIVSDPHWPGRMRQAAQEEYRLAGSTHDIIKDGYSRLMRLVPDDNGPETIAALRRVIGTMRAFRNLSEKQKLTLRGFDHLTDLAFMKARIKADPVAFQNVRLDYLAQAWASDPYLASLRELIDADHARAEKYQAEELERQAAAILARDKAQAEASGYVLQLHKRGIRLNLTEDGTLELFPASLLTQEDLAFARDYGSFLADAMQAETSTHTLVSQVR